MKWCTTTSNEDNQRTLTKEWHDSNYSNSNYVLGNLFKMALIGDKWINIWESYHIGYTYAICFQLKNV